jgi:hypothetical protein
MVVFGELMWCTHCHRRRENFAQVGDERSDRTIAHALERAVGNVTF